MLMGIFFLLFFGVLIFSFRLLRRQRRLSGHGPPEHPLLGCLLSFCRNRHRLLDWYTEMLAESPSQTIVVKRLGAARTVVTANPENIEYILKRRFENFPKGRPFTDILGDFLGRGIFNVDGELWHSQRKLASHEFSTRSLRDYVVNTLDAESAGRLLPILAAAAAGDKVVDLQDLLRRFAFDTVCRVSLGKDPAYLSPSLPSSTLADSFDVASAISAGRAAAPVYAVWKLKRLLGLGSERRLRDAISRVHDSVTDLIDHKRKTENGEEDNLLSRLISGGHGDDVVRDMAISFIMAGRDTTSAALTWFFWLLSQHPEREAELLQEIEGKKLDYDGLKEMKVLEAYLCESMRLYPPVAWDSKHAKSDDILPDGTVVERGDRITYFPYGVGRMERVWGKDWAEFRPERWLEAGGAAMVKVSPYQFPVFQAGPRVCLGKEMAFLQMKLVAASVLREFELKAVSTEQPRFVPLLTAVMAGGFQVRLQRRRSS